MTLQMAEYYNFAPRTRNSFVKSMAQKHLSPTTDMNLVKRMRMSVINLEMESIDDRKGSARALHFYNSKWEYHYPWVF